ncbi:AsmA family protein [Marinomonas sp. M1K-6]|uniref:AsmA family protein n=1 Tax=Marinomonas profundi TaxID=2726122 RepID=A0A847R2J2_9GAMM|nr:AsmA family protein [Marinomonas profundi]NLQ18071.1 AsmA family protein [Marinomonas profundi]UDV04142.1 AsmA family protein [Marinomonas profundi]
MVWVKRLSLLVAGLLAIVVLLLAYVMLFVNPNDFKDELKSVALEKANVSLRLDGDISWSFFPWLGLSLENIGVALGTDAEIVQFDRAEFGLAILPLLEQKIQVNKVNLVNLKASLNKDAQGQGNWQLDLPSETSEAGSANAPSAPAATSDTTASAVADTATNNATGKVKLPDIQLDELRIENAQVQYRDEQAKQLINATLNVQLNDVQWDKAWPMVMDIAVTQSDLQGQSPMSAKATLNANLTVFPERESLSLDSLVVSTELEGEALPTSPLSAKLSAMTLDVDLPQENVLIEGLALSVLGVNIDAKIQAYQVLSEPQFSAVVSLGEFNPRYLMTRLKLPLPDMSDDTALTKLMANVTLEGSLNSITAQPISIILDDTSIEANAEVALSPLRWDVNVAGANLNLDRYLPTPVEPVDNQGEAVSSAPQEGGVEGAETAETAAGELIPVELIRSLNGHVGILFENIIVKKLKIDKVEFDSTQANGLVLVSPLQAELYKGTVSSNVRLDVRGKTPVLSLTPTVSALQIQPLLVDFMDMDKVAGATFLNGELKTSGNRIDDLMSGLQGDLLIEVKNGALVGTNLTKTVCEGIAAIRKESIDEKQFGPDTPFETLRFPAYIVNGQVSTPGLQINSAGIQVTGNGVVSLPDSSLDYQANVGIAGSALDNACRVNEKVIKLAFPIVCKGQFSDDPAGLCRPDIKGFGQLFADLAKDELAQKAAEEKARLTEKLEAEKARLKTKAEAEKARLKAELEEKRQAEEERLKEKLKDKLKSLF